MNTAAVFFIPSIPGVPDMYYCLEQNWNARGDVAPVAANFIFNFCVPGVFSAASVPIADTADVGNMVVTAHQLKQILVYYDVIQVSST